VETDASDDQARRRGDHGANQPRLLRSVGRELREAKRGRDTLLPAITDTSPELPLDLGPIATGHRTQQRRRQRDEPEATRRDRISHAHILFKKSRRWSLGIAALFAGLEPSVLPCREAPTGSAHQVKGLD
jgi:hypothetical protein